MSGIAVRYAGSLIYWRSTLQKSVTLSSSEAEYVAASDAARIVQWLQQVAFEWNIDINRPTPLYMDNTAAISMAAANGLTTRSKHIDTKAHFLREKLKKALYVLYMCKAINKLPISLQNHYLLQRFYT